MAGELTGLGGRRGVASRIEDAAPHSRLVSGQGTDAFGREMLGAMHRTDADDQRCGLPTSQLSLKGLDWLVHSDPGLCGDDDGASESDAVSEALSVMSAMSAFDADDVIPIDSERYARICGKIERLRRAVGKRDVKVREAKARLAEQRRTIRSTKGELLSLRAQVGALRSQVDRESTAKVEAVDKAAVALLDRERLQQENERLRERERLAADHLKTQHASSTQMGDLHLKASEEVHDLRAQLAVVAQEKTQLELACRDIREDLEDAQLRLVELGQRNSELESQVTQLKETNDQIDRRCSEQQRQLVRGEEGRIRLQELLTEEREENKHHVAHLLQTVIKLQGDLERVKSQYCRAKEGSLVLREASGMLNEELRLSCMETERVKRAVSSYQEQLQAASREYRGVVKQCRELDVSRRRMLAVFVPTRKQLAVIDAGMSKLCLELQHIGKTVAVGRYRSDEVLMWCCSLWC